jgi:lipopolysaccharide/colanic/teichoic acid biosynthesis glycosyltransferase
MFVDFDLRQFADGSTYSNAKVVNRSNVQSFLKRLTDITISLIALLCLAPLFLILACLIKAENHGLSPSPERKGWENIFNLKIPLHGT